MPISVVLSVDFDCGTFYMAEGKLGKDGFQGLGHLLLLFV